MVANAKMLTQKVENIEIIPRMSIDPIKSVLNMLKSELWDSLSQVEKDNFDHFVKRKEIPLGTKRPFYAYKGRCQVSDIVTMKIDLNNIMNLLMVTFSGSGKTRLLKRIMKYLQLMGCDIMAFDPKGGNFLSGGTVGTCPRLHPFERKTTLDIVSCMPSFVANKMEESMSPKKFKQHIKFSYDMKSLKNPMVWRALGFADKGANFMIQQIEKGRTFDQISSILNKKNSREIRNMHRMTVKGADSALSMLSDLKLFDSKYKPLDLEKLWSQGKIVTIPYHMQYKPYVKFDVGHKLELAQNIGIKQRMHGKVTPKFFIYDDAHSYLTPGNSRSEYNFAIENCINSMIVWREFGSNNIISVQNIKKIDPNLSDEFQEFIIGPMNNVEGLRELISVDVVNEIPNLINDRTHYNVQHMYVNFNKQCQMFFPFDTMVGH